MSRDDDNRDYLKGANYPRQSYALSGMQWGDSKSASVRGKRPADGAPMIVSPTPPGAFAFSDDAWKITFGASNDAFLSLVNGDRVQDNKLESIANAPKGVFQKVPSIATTNTYEMIDGKQQIQYVVSKNTIDDASNAKTHGATNETRGLGLRTPSIMAGWGYTTAMLPTDPNPLDVRDNDNEHKFDRATWKEGPIDLRWDPRRKMWRGWNDLIAEHKSEDMSTFVFGGNSQGEQKAFPFQRGGLNNVWHVRYMEPIADYDGFGYPQINAEVCTRLQSRVFDENAGGAFRWDTILTCRSERASKERTVGVEQTYYNGTMEILTGAPFLSIEGLTGPIAFASDVFIDDDVTGVMKFKDSQWVPTVNLRQAFITNPNILPPICSIPQAPQQFSITIDNDLEIGSAIEELSEELCEYFEDELVPEVETYILSLSGETARNHANIVNLTSDINVALNDNFNYIMVSMQLTANALTQLINIGLESITLQVNNCLRQIGGEGFSECVIKPVVNPPVLEGIVIDPIPIPEALIVPPEPLPLPEWEILRELEEPCSGATFPIEIIC